ncbi:MAG: hypothetical protein WC805_00430 [Patescibacteria group bacterium]|jgi:DNA-3-methyladenine glycosylase II
MAKIIPLNHRTIVQLVPVSPYNFDATIHKPSHFPSSDNEWEKGKYWITMRWKGQNLGLKLENEGTTKKPKLKLNVYSQKPLTKDFIATLIPEIEWRFNLKSDISEFSNKFEDDEVLGPVLKKWKGMKPVAANSLYETLMIYIVLQNATVRRTAQMLENLFNKFGKQVSFGNKVLYTFWEPQDIEKVSEEDLRVLKLGYRAKFIKKISQQFAS